MRINQQQKMISSKTLSIKRYQVYISQAKPIKSSAQITRERVEIKYPQFLKMWETLIDCTFNFRKKKDWVHMLQLIEYTKSLIEWRKILAHYQNW